MRFALILSSAAVCALAGGLLASCSDPVPQTPDGAFFAAMITDDPLKCTINGFTAQVGAVDGQNRNTVVSDGMSLSDGGVPTKVSCTVSGTTTFSVHGLIDDVQGTGNYFEMQIDGLTVGQSKDSPAHGTGILSSAAHTAGEPYQGPCDFWFTAMTGETVNATGGAGKVWVTFSCAGLTSGMSTCPLKTGYAIFENCLTDTSM
jgi:hypothetical protein